MNIRTFFQAVWTQDAEALAAFFAPDAYVNWPRFQMAAGQAYRCAYHAERNLNYG